ncbi:MAG: CinA family nicotinamide mononucleotide deamidase-related protein [Gammaproteobacteria bacterium]|nr:CinA family nicotinamide mononucleotide deamidase-related protein [Gammaproteobacteria bacterium]
MHIEIICTGDEVLSGKTINTNYSHMARRLQEVGLDVHWGTTVGDDRDALREAFRLAAGRARAVIVNGGLGPTVDDLSQEMAAEAAGVDLELDSDWLARIEAFYASRGRVMPPNNRKQAMLPRGAERIDNPIGTACGFAVDIGGARFLFTPGVPRELRRMLDEQIIPRLLQLSGRQSVVQLLRFHSFGLGESRVDQMLNGIEQLAEDGEVKLGFQAHFPQLETKLFARGSDADALTRRLAPVAAAVRERLGSYLLCEADQTLEGVVLESLAAQGASLAVAECGTHGAVAGRLVAADPRGRVFQRGGLGADPRALCRALGVDAGDGSSSAGGSAQLASQLAAAVRQTSATSHGLAVLVEPGEAGTEGWVHVATSSDAYTVQRSACLVGGAERVRGGGVELALDCLRRGLQGLSVHDPIDFEKQR